MYLTTYRLCVGQLLPIVVSLRDGEVAGRRQLEELGLNASERLNSKGRKSRFVSSDDEEDYECEKCRTNLFISFVSTLTYSLGSTRCYWTQ